MFNFISIFAPEQSHTYLLPLLLLLIYSSYYHTIFIRQYYNQWRGGRDIISNIRFGILKHIKLKNIKYAIKNNKVDKFRCSCRACCCNGYVIFEKSLLTKNDSEWMRCHPSIYLYKYSNLII